MNRKNKIRLVLCILLLVVAAISAYALVNVAICFNPFDSGGCIAVVYDKAAMRAADKVVLCVGENRYDITNAALVDDITEELMVATHSCLRYSKIDRWIEIYSGDTLVRRMLWANCVDETGVFVYQEDSTHQIYRLYYTGPEDGMIFPSKKLVEKLNAIIEAAENTTK